MTLSTHSPAELLLLCVPTYHQGVLEYLTSNFQANSCQNEDLTLLKTLLQLRLQSSLDAFVLSSSSHTVCFDTNHLVIAIAIVI